MGDPIWNATVLVSGMCSSLTKILKRYLVVRTKLVKKTRYSVRTIVEEGELEALLLQYVRMMKWDKIKKYVMLDTSWRIVGTVEHEIYMYG